jgi:O-antigen ligase
MLRRLCALALSAEPLLLLWMIPAVPVPQNLLYLGLVIPPVLWLCAWVATGHLIEPTPLDWSIAPLLGLMGFSQLVAMDAGYSLPKVTALIWGVVTYYIVVRWVASTQALRLATWVYLGLGGWLAIVGLFASTPVPKASVLTQIMEAIPDLITRLWGFNVNPNNIGGAMVAFVPLQLALLLAAWRGRARQALTTTDWARLAIQALGLALTGGTLALTQTRGAWLGMLIALVTLAAWRLGRRRPLLASGLVALVVLAAWLTPEIAVWVAGQTGDLAEVESVLWRQELWQDVYRVIADYPLTGLGIVRLREVLPLLYPVASLSDTSLLLRQAHSQVLEVAVSFGLPAVVAFVAIWIGIGRMMISAWRRAPDAWSHALIEGLSAGLVGSFVFGWTESLFINHKVGPLLWLVFGLAAAAYRVLGWLQPHTQVMAAVVNPRPD